MPITAIFTKQNTTVTITTNENLLLEQLDSVAQKLVPGDNKVAIGPGAFRIYSKQPVRVSTITTSDVHVVSMGDKQGGPIELVKLLPPGFNGDDVVKFIELKSHTLQ
jgi:hypothetical protein